MKKFTVAVPALLTVLKKMNGVVIKNPLLTALKSVRIQVKESSLVITASDLIVTLKAELEIENLGKSGYEYLVPFKYLHDVWSLISDEKVTIELLSKTMAQITTADDTYKMSCFDTKDWPDEPEFLPRNAVGVSSDFIDALDTALDTTGTDSMRPVLQKVLVSIEPGKLTIASTNAYILYERCFQAEVVSGTDLLIQEKIIQLAKGFKETSISWSSTHLSFVSNNYILIGTLQDEKYPDYKAIIPPPCAPNLIVSAAELKLAMQKISLTELEATLHLKKEAGYIVCESKDSDRESVVKIAADYTGDCEKVVVQPAFFTTLLGQIKYTTVSIAIIAANQGIVMTAEADDTYRSMLMPQVTK